MNIILQVCFGFLRAAICALGGTQMAGDNEMNQLYGSLAVLISIIWSIYEKVKAGKKTSACE